MEHAEEENWEESKFQEAIYVEATHFGLEKDTHHETRSEAHGYEKKHQQ